MKIEAVSLLRGNILAFSFWHVALIINIGGKDMMKRNLMGRGLLTAALLVVGLAVAGPANADSFNLTSCHISTGCPPAGTVFGTVTLTQSGTSVLFDVVLNSGNRFVETGAGGDSLFIFNDTVAGSTVTNIS